MPRLLHIMDYEPRGTRTIDHFILDLSRAMQASGWEVRFAFGAQPPPEFQRTLAEVGAGYVVIPFPFTRSSVRELLHRLNGYRPDLIQTSFLSAFCWPLLRLKLQGRTRRLVVIDHSSGEAPIRRGWRKWSARLRGWAVGKIVDAVVPVSQAIATRDIERVFLPARKIRVVYNGIALERFPSPPRAERGAVRVVYVGQLIPEKGVTTLLRAHRTLRGGGVAGYELLIAGQGSQEHELKSYCESAGLLDVRFLGHLDSVPELLGSADVVVVPSIWFEAFGLALVEAMACGAACLVSDAGALAEVVGEAGRVFKAGDDGDLALRLQELIEAAEDRRRLGLAARKRVETLFTLDRMVEGHKSVCEDALAGSPIPSGDLAHSEEV